MAWDHSITHFFQVVNTRDLDALGALLTDKAELDFPKAQPILGRDRILKFFRILFRQYPELHFQVQRKIVQGDAAAVHWTNEGTSRRGEPYGNEGVTILQREGDRISYISDFFKDTEKF